MKRPPFLPTFFAVLGVVFLGVLFVRIRSYEAHGETSSRPRHEAPPPAVAAPVNRTSSSGNVPHYEIEPAEPVTTGASPQRAATTAAPENRSETQSAPVDPVSRIVERIWFEPASLPAGISKPLHVRVARDSNILAMSAVLHNVQRTARLTAECSAAQDSTWDCAMNVPSCAACGRWDVTELRIQRANGDFSVAAPHPLLTAGRVHLAGDRCDSLAPVLHVVTVDESDDSNLLMTLAVADGFCGVGAVTGIAESASGQHVTFKGVESDESTWAVQLPWKSLRERGRWRVTSIEVADRAGNFRVYSSQDAVLKDTGFDAR